MKTRDTIIRQTASAILAVQRTSDRAWKLKRLRQIGKRYRSSHGHEQSGPPKLGFPNHYFL